MKIDKIRISQIISLIIFFSIFTNKGFAYAWQEVTPVGVSPSARWGNTSINDIGNHQMVMFGGRNDSNLLYYSDIWAAPFSGPQNWQQVSPQAGPSPAPRWNHTAVYDSANQRMVIFGGANSTDDSSLFNDTWALSLSGTPTWTNISPAGVSPTARELFNAVYDAANQRMIVFGGYDGTTYFSDTWALSLSGTPTWTQLSPSSPPPGRDRHSAIYDWGNETMVIFGGQGIGANPLSDTWTLALSGSPSWSELTPSGSPPTAVASGSAIYDSCDQQLVYFGGTAPYSNSVYTLNLTGSPSWNQISPTGTLPVARNGQSAVYDSDNYGMLFFGGSDGSNYQNDLWDLSLPCVNSPTPTITPTPTVTGTASPTDTTTVSPSATPSPTETATPENFCSVYRDDFNGPTFNSNFTWVDPVGDIVPTFSGGTLSYILPAGRNFAGGFNFNAPRLGISISGDFEAETRVTCTAATGGLSWFVGLCAITGNGNEVGTQLVNLQGSNPTNANHEVLNGFGADVPIGATTAWFRLLRQGSVYSSFYSTDGAAWNPITVTTDTTDPVFVGILAKTDGGITAIYDYIDIKLPCSQITFTLTPTLTDTPTSTPMSSLTTTQTLTMTPTPSPTSSPIPVATATPAPLDPGDGIIVGPSPIQCPSAMVRFRMDKPGRYRVKVLGLRGQVEKTVEGEDHGNPQLGQCRLSCDDLASGLHFILVEIDYDDGTSRRIKPTKCSVLK